jgi:hypothetical protein
VDYTGGLGLDIGNDDNSTSSKVLSAAQGAPATQGIAAASVTDADGDLAHQASKGKDETVFTYGERIENQMESTCRALGIKYKLFDIWPGLRRPGQNGGHELMDLPYELLTMIFSFSTGSDLLSLRQTCKIFKALLECNRYVLFDSQLFRLFAC